jgi:hypothetical protein
VALVDQAADQAEAAAVAVAAAEEEEVGEVGA